MDRGKNKDTWGKNIILITKVNFLTPASCQNKEKMAEEGGEKLCYYFPLWPYLFPKKKSVKGT
jgi:hypothetical protein